MPDRFVLIENVCVLQGHYVLTVHDVPLCSFVVTALNSSSLGKFCSESLSLPSAT